ncbi:MAG: hypothetical protein ACI363_04795 [Phocaeicola plebeius]
MRSAVVPVYDSLIVRRMNRTSHRVRRRAAVELLSVGGEQAVEFGAAAEKER